MVLAALIITGISGRRYYKSILVFPAKEIETDDLHDGERSNIALKFTSSGGNPSLTVSGCGLLPWVVVRGLVEVVGGRDWRMGGRGGGMAGVGTRQKTNRTQING